MWSLSRIALILTIPLLAAAGRAEPVCTATQKCESGCCRIDPVTGKGNCGLGPTFCGPGNCTSTCDAKSDCDPNGWGSKYANAEKCPLNVCCSKYGFCGTDPEFCGSKTVPKPSCSGKSSDKRTIGYFEGWNLERPCNTMKPSDIPLGYYTHINFAFALLNPSSFNIVPMNQQMSPLFDEVSKLKFRQPDLQVWISIGGWSFNDPGPTRTTFSDLAASPSAQSTFFNSLITFMKAHRFDGVDLDWEYPVADDRGGRPEDFDNFVVLLSNLRKALDNSGMPQRPGLSITIPSSYWYLRHFDIVRMDPIIDWFNVMTYDIHGVWDANIPSLGSYVKAHTNLSEIESALELLWRNNIDPDRVLLGLGFYGRSFTLQNPSCKAAGCNFTTGGAPGPCTSTSGVLSAVEIRNEISKGAKVTFDALSASKIVTWGADQWVSYDDTETLKLKQNFANQRCLGGTLIWAIDLDDGSSINDLGGNLGRQKAPVFETHGPSSGGGDLGTWPDTALFRPA